MTNKKALKPDFLRLLKKHEGCIKDACLELKIERKTYYNWYNADPEFQEAVEFVFEDCLDDIRNDMIRLARTGVGGHFPALKYILETRFLRRRENESLSDIVNNTRSYQPTAVDYEIMEAYLAREAKRKKEMN